MPKVTVTISRSVVNGITVEICSDYDDLENFKNITFTGETSLEARACELAKLYMVSVLKNGKTTENL